MFKTTPLHLLACISAFAATVGVLLYALPRGLDLTDESLSILLAQPETLRLSAIHSQMLFDLQHRAFGIEWSVSDLRIGRFFLATISGALLGYAVQRNRQQGHVFTGALMGATFGLLQYTGNGHVAGITYNAIHWWSAITLTSLLLLYRHRSSLWIPVAIGSLGFIMWTCKFPAALSMFFVVMMWVWLGQGHVRKKAIHTAILILTPVLLMVSLTQPNHPISPLDYLDILKQARNGSHDAGRTLLRSGLQFGLMYGVLAPAALGGYFLRKHAKSNEIQRWIESGFVLAFIAIGAVHAFGTMDLKSLQWIVPGSLAAWQLGKHFGERDFWTGLALLILPAIITLGTNATWIYHFLALSLFPLMSAKLMGVSTRTLFATLTVPLLVFSSVVKNPRRQPPLWTCTAPITLGKTGDRMWVHPWIQPYLVAHAAIQQEYPYPTFGEDRFFGEILIGSNPTPAEALWAADRTNANHTVAWNTHDTLLVAILGTTPSAPLEAGLPGRSWTKLASISRAPVLDSIQTKIWISEESVVQYYLVTRP